MAIFNSSVEQDIWYNIMQYHAIYILEFNAYHGILATANTHILFDGGVFLELYHPYKFSILQLPT